MNTEICVPASALASDGEGGESMAPEVGDTVNVQVEGQVTRTEGGQTYVQVVSANGVPVSEGGKMEDAEMGDAEIEDEMRSGKADAYPRGMLAGLLFGLLVGCVAFRASAADPATSFAERVYNSSGAVSNHIALTTPQQVFSIEIDNYGSSVTNYLMIFDRTTNPTAGDRPAVTAVPIGGQSMGGKDWGNKGCPFQNGVVVCLSTTPFTLTNAGTIGGNVTVIYSRRN